MLARVLVFSAFACAFFLNETHVHANPEKENKDPRPSFSKKRKALPSLPKPPAKRIKTTPLSPSTLERKYFSPIRRKMSLEQYKNGQKSLLSSPHVRDIYKKHSQGSYFTRTYFNKKTVFQTNQLFDPHAKVLSEKGHWESNLERMERGLSPIGHKGIATEFEKENQSAEDIRQTQKRWRIDLQHVTQRDSGTDLDPICEMTHAAHLGLNARMLLKYDFTTNEIHIVHSSLEKDEALALIKENETLFMVTNVLHFRLGGSLINRVDFSKWREAYWKNRAKEYDSFPQPTPLLANFFDSPAKGTCQQEGKEEAF